MLFSGAWEKMIHEKKPEAKYLVTLSLLKCPNTFTSCSLISSCAMHNMSNIN
jgi:hypothetical protein